jgi:hypothetical protein
MKLRCPELFRVPRPSEKQHILEMQAQNMLDERDGSGRRVYIFRVGQYSYLYVSTGKNAAGTDTPAVKTLTVTQ